MSLRETTIDLEEELQRLKDEREELAAAVAGMDSGTARQAKAQEGVQMDSYIDGVAWAAHNAADDDDVEAWDEDVSTITLSGLTGGEFSAVEGELAEYSNGRNPAKVQRVFQVRAGTVDAPYVGDDMTEDEEIYATASLPPGFLLWAEWKIDELSQVSDELGNDFGDLVAEKREEQASKS